MRKKAIIGGVITILVMGAFIGAAINFWPFPKVKQLPSAEVRQYQGQNLSSVNDFRENSIKGPQYIDINTYRLNVTGLVARPATYNYDEVLRGFQSYKKIVTLYCVEGWAVRILWEGPLVRDILAASGPLPAANTIIFHCYDGFTTSQPMANFTQNDIIMAYKMNDIAIPPERGFPFMLVAEDKWGYKWAKWITEIEVSDNVDYHGYWESRAYSNNGSLEEPYFDFSQFFK